MSEIEARLEALLERDGVTVEDLRRGVAELDAADGAGADGHGASADDRDASAADDHGSATATALKAGGLLGLLGFGSGFAAAGAASQDSGPQGRVGTSSQPLRALYTQELNGPVTGDTAVTSLVGDGLAVDSGALSAAPARPDVDTGGTPVENVPEIEFGEGLTVTDDGDGTVTVETDTSATLTVSQFGVGERGAGDSFAVDVTVAETNIDATDNYGLTVEDVTVTLTVTDGDGNTEYNQERTTDVPPGGTLVTFGVDGSTAEVGPLNTGDYTAMVTIDAANVDSVTATDAFTVRESTSPSTRSPSGRRAPTRSSRWPRRSRRPPVARPRDSP